MKTLQGKAVYQYFADKKDEIEAEFGSALEWAELPGKNTSIISLSLEGADFRERDEWDTQFEWLATNLERLDKTFRKRIKEFVG